MLVPPRAGERDKVVLVVILSAISRFTHDNFWPYFFYEHQALPALPLSISLISATRREDA